jgi:hypothetical protein
MRWLRWSWLLHQAPISFPRTGAAPGTNEKSLYLATFAHPHPLMLADEVNLTGRLLRGKMGYCFSY